jgi:hypothetical protein
MSENGGGSVTAKSEIEKYFSQPSLKLRSTFQKKMGRISKGLTFSSTRRTMKIDFQFYLTWLEIS